MPQKLLNRLRIEAILRQLQPIVKSENLKIISINGRFEDCYHIYSSGKFLCKVKKD